MLLILGALFGLAIAFLWWAAYMRHTASYDFRMALANESEPPKWKLLDERGKQFSLNQPVTVQGVTHQIKWPGTMTTKNSVRYLILLFALAYGAILVFGIVRAATQTTNSTRTTTG